MVRVSQDRVRLASADWGGLCSLALTVVMLVGATLYKVHDTAAAVRAREARIDAELDHLDYQVKRLQQDVRLLLARQPQ